MRGDHTLVLREDSTFARTCNQKTCSIERLASARSSWYGSMGAVAITSIKAVVPIWTMITIKPGRLLSRLSQGGRRASGRRTGAE